MCQDWPHPPLESKVKNKNYLEKEMSLLVGNTWKGATSKHVGLACVTTSFKKCILSWYRVVAETGFKNLKYHPELAEG